MEWLQDFRWGLSQGHVQVGVGAVRVVSSCSTSACTAAEGTARQRMARPEIISRLLRVPRVAASPVIRFKMLIEPLCALSRVIPSQKLSIAFAARTTQTSRFQTFATL